MWTYLVCNCVLFLYRVNSPPNPTPISYGQNIAGTISPQAELDVYSFSGAVGDKLLVRMLPTSSSLEPQIRVFRSDGSSLCSAANPFTNGASGLLELSTCVLDNTDPHTILVSDNFGDETGNYVLTLQRTNGLANSTGIAYEQTLAATIDLGVELDTYVFTGSSGDAILIRVNTTSGGLDPEVRIFRPDGTGLCSGQRSTPGLLEVR